MPSPHVSPADGTDVFSYTVDPAGTQLGARFDAYGRRRNGTTTKPTVVAQSGAGTGASATVSGTDEAGIISLTMGSAAWATGAQVILTFSQPYNTAPVISLDAGDAGSAKGALYASASTTALTVSAATAAVATGTWLLHYRLIGGA